MRGDPALRVSCHRSMVTVGTPKTVSYDVLLHSGDCLQRVRAMDEQIVRQGSTQLTYGLRAHGFVLMALCSWQAVQVVSMPRTSSQRHRTLFRRRAGPQGMPTHSKAWN